jgi:hypothetical protein
VFQNVRLIGQVVMAAMLPVVIGCGEPSGLVGFTGEVSLDGAPLKYGTIRLTSMGPDMAARGTKIHEGRYEVTQTKGLPPGTYHVSISAGAESETEYATKAPGGGPGMAFAKQLIPAEYNVDSDKTVEVSMEGDNHFVFEILSDG